MLDQTRDFVEFIEFCASRSVKFLIVGGYALAAHGHPRATKDLDVWVLPDLANAERLLDALSDFGMGSLGLAADDFMEPGTVVQLGYPPVRIDILTSPDGVEFDACWERRIEVQIGRATVGVVSRRDLIDNKLASGRAQDLADVEVLRLGPSDAI